MAALQRYVPRSPSQLLSHILDRSELVAAIRELPPPALHRLIERIGVEDSGDLISLATTEQITALLDEDLWRGDESGFDTNFDPGRFTLWLQVMGEAGDDFLVRRLCELPVDLLTLAINRLVLVVDMDALRSFYAGARDELGQLESALENAVAEEWEEFCLIARDLDAWEEVWNALLLLDREHHERLRAILEQCCAMALEYINGQGGLYDVLTSDEMLENDALATRDDRRTSLGYVSRSDAHAFLELARDERQPLAQRDPVTAAHFRALPAARRNAPVPVAAGHLAVPRRVDGAIQELMQLVADLEPPSAAQATRRLVGGETHEGATQKSKRTSLVGRDAAPPRKAPIELRLQVALVELSDTEPLVHAARFEELAYLANVVIAGCNHDGRKLRPIEALEAAIATTNLGLELWPPSAKNEDDRTRVRDIGCDRFFRLAWSTVQRDLVLVARETLTRRCAGLAAPGARRAQRLIEKQSLHELRRVCSAHDLDMTDEDFALLATLAEPIPFLPTSHAQADGTVWVATREQLDRARRSLAALSAR